VAIGAGRGQVLRMVLGNGLALAFAGVAIGIAVAALASRLMRTLLYGVTPGDPLTYLAVAVGLSLVAVAASLVPAWRATRVDPVVALKTE
jgi:ABC-type antimicrobial peptide transport system permease subunit